MAVQQQFGARLKAAREARGISLRDVAATTKISLVALEALEHDDPSRLPGGIFSRSFVRSYAIEVGLDPDATVSEFSQRFPDSVQPLRDVAVLAPPVGRSSAGRPWGGLAAGLVLLLAFGTGVLMMGWADLRLPFAKRTDQGPSPSAAPPLPVSAPAPASTGDAVLPEVDRVERALDAVPDAVPAEAASAPGGPEATHASGVSNLVALGQDEPMRLTIQPVARCWVKVVADGRVVLSRELVAGERAVHDADAEILLTVGDAGAFVYSINDVPGRALGAPGKVVTIRIRRSNLTDFVAS